jgi:hypothetical protein
MGLKDGWVKIRDRGSGRHDDDDGKPGLDRQPQRNEPADAFVDANVQSQQTSALVLRRSECKRLRS